MYHQLMQPHIKAGIIPAFILVAFGFLQVYLYTSNPPESRLLQFNAIEASPESRRPLRIPITIVTAASGNHACALEAFLYHMDALFAQLDLDPDQIEQRLQERIQRGLKYATISRDLEVIRPKTRLRIKSKKAKNKSNNKDKSMENGTGIKTRTELGETGTEKRIKDSPDADLHTSGPEKRNDDEVKVKNRPDSLANDDGRGGQSIKVATKIGVREAKAESDAKESRGSKGSSNTNSSQRISQGSHRLYEIRPKIVVYNMGMTPGKRKKRRLRALLEAGLVDEAFDFDFEKYPSFWALNPVTRGEYGWKVGIVNEVIQRVLAESSTTSADTESGTLKMTQQIRKRQGHVSDDLNDDNNSDDDGDWSLEDTDDRNSNMAEEEMTDQEAKEWASVEEVIDESNSSDMDKEAFQEQDEDENTMVDEINQTGGQKSNPPSYKNTSQIDTGKSSLPTPHEPGIVLWLDSGDRISLAFLRWLPSFMRHYGLWTPQSQDFMSTWTHPGMLKYFGDSIDQFPEEETNCNGAAIAFDIHNTTVREGLLKQWVQCAMEKDCIAPQGSSRENHRQDQAALTYLVKTMGFSDELCHGMPEAFGVQVNQDHYCHEDIASNLNRVISN
ncbi:hypothetical protein BGW38_006358 [Lunasporangiospora selenospora]|uniref:Uncharacterized protein n=1 Tax=Lunasporangiospora selenospora TaxID=979761 RepID=A0A9P6KG95_9FUNG|nr:hypothetical protein BGW38_006358 [Lunasporangiospora selenospora]